MADWNSQYNAVLAASFSATTRQFDSKEAVTESVIDEQVEASKLFYGEVLDSPEMLVWLKKDLLMLRDCFWVVITSEKTEIKDGASFTILCE